MIGYELSLLITLEFHLYDQLRHESPSNERCDHITMESWCKEEIKKQTID